MQEDIFKQVTTQRNRLITVEFRTQNDRLNDNVILIQIVDWLLRQNVGELASAYFSL